MKTITQQELQHFLLYDKNSGIFIWKNSISKNVKNGSVAGHINVHGYVQIKVNHKLFLAHRLAWLYEYGKFPDRHIDHIDHNRSNNAIENIREVTPLENSRNQGMSKKNTSGVTGVYWREDRSKWYAVIMIHGKNITLGTFANMEDAILCRKNANIDFNFHINHGDCPYLSLGSKLANSRGVIVRSSELCS